MFRSIFKVLYIGLAIVLALLLYIAGYNTNAYNHINGVTSAAIEEKNYVEVAKIHGGCFDVNNVATEDSTLNSNNYELAIFKSGTLLTESVYVSETTSEEKNLYDFSYYIFLFGVTDTLDKTIDGTTITNDTAFNFVGTEGTYTYYFKVSSTYNKDYYIEKPASIGDSLLGSERNLFTNLDNWGFINLTLTETLLTSMNIGSIKQIQVTNTSGEVVYVQNVNLDFNKEEGFFKQITPLVSAYNEYIEGVTGDATSEEISAAETKFNEFYTAFEPEFLKDENNSFRHEDSYLQPSKLVLKTIGLLAIYAVAVVIFYILLFNFAMIKKIFVKNSYSNSYGQRAVLKNKKDNSIKAEVIETE